MTSEKRSRALSAIVRATKRRRGVNFAAKRVPLAKRRRLPSSMMSTWGSLPVFWCFFLSLAGTDSHCQSTSARRDVATRPNKLLPICSGHNKRRSISPVDTSRRKVTNQRAHFAQQQPASGTALSRSNKLSEQWGRYPCYVQDQTFHQKWAVRWNMKVKAENPHTP
eukprot:4822592-Prymnesium_polylepis.1